ncbi:unnamed protein product [Brachionus calyciflorus]|uniref:Uncharacterized protein n=1 Tax=Brachionus calyciflorus TaxID=104777 RepID=A0A813MA71_9BILA|nr:unnamed protein product [Brachionus calyciflorus]
MSPRLIQTIFISLFNLTILLIVTIFCIIIIKTNTSTLIGGTCTSDSNCKGYETGTVYCKCGTCSCIDSTKYEAPSTSYSGSNYRCFVKSGYSCSSDSECEKSCISSVCS